MPTHKTAHLQAPKQMPTLLLVKELFLANALTEEFIFELLKNHRQ